MRILFMGTPQFAAVSLQQLVVNNFQIVGIVTQPDKPRGRGMKLQPSEVKMVATQHQLPLWQPAKVAAHDFLEVFHQLQPDLVVVVAFGQKIPSEILFEPKYGCINVHGSLLPKYRGAAPIQWTILNDETTAGVTTMYMDEGWDTGDMIYQATTAVDPNENFSTLYSRLAELGGDLLIKTIEALAGGTAPRIAQNDDLAVLAPKLNPKLRLVDWNLPAQTIHNRVRVFAPSPGAETSFNDETLKIIETRLVLENEPTGKPGEIIKLVKNSGILVGTGSQSLLITKLQPSGKKMMSATDYANGRRLQTGMFFV